MQKRSGITGCKSRLPLGKREDSPASGTLERTVGGDGAAVIRSKVQVLFWGLKLGGTTESYMPSSLQ